MIEFMARLMFASVISDSWVVTMAFRSVRRDPTFMMIWSTVQIGISAINLKDDTAVGAADVGPARAGRARVTG